MDKILLNNWHKQELKLNYTPESEALFRESTSYEKWADVDTDCVSQQLLYLEFVKQVCEFLIDAHSDAFDHKGNHLTKSENNGHKHFYAWCAVHDVIKNLNEIRKLVFDTKVTLDFGPGFMLHQFLRKEK